MLTTLIYLDNLFHYGLTKPTKTSKISNFCQITYLAWPPWRRKVPLLLFRPHIMIITLFSSRAHSFHLCCVRLFFLQQLFCLLKHLLKMFWKQFPWWYCWVVFILYEWFWPWFSSFYSWLFIAIGMIILSFISSKSFFKWLKALKF